MVGQLVGIRTLDDFARAMRICNLEIGNQYHQYHYGYSGLTMHIPGPGGKYPFDP